MFSLVGATSGGQHAGEITGLWTFSLSKQAGNYFYSAGKAKSETGKRARFEAPLSNVGR